MATKRGVTRVVDAHIHLWDVTRTDWYPYLSGAEQLGMGDVSAFCRTYDQPTYFGETAGWNVEKFVHVTAARRDHVGETLLLDAQAQESGHPDAIIGAIVAGASLAASEEVLDAQMRSSRFRGVRTVRGEDQSGSHTGRFPSRDVLAALEERGLVFDFMVHPHQLNDAAERLRPFEELTMVLEHTGWPRSDSDDEFALWRDGMIAVAGINDRVHCKLSGLAMPFRSMAPEVFRRWIVTALEIFGVDRCMFASNFPVDGVAGTFDALYSTYSALTDDLDDDEREKLFASNAERVYRC